MSRQRSRANGHANRRNHPIGQKPLQTWLRTGTGLNAVVVVGLFVQKGQELSSLRASSLRALACCGVYMLVLCVFAFVHYGKTHRHFLARLCNGVWAPTLLGLAGSVALLVSVTLLDKVPPHEVIPAKEKVRDTSSVALRGLQIAHNAEATRIVSHVINRSGRVLVLDKASFMFANNRVELVCPLGVERYELGKELTPTGDGEVRTEAMGRSDALDGFSIDVRGPLWTTCGQTYLCVELPTRVQIDPEATTSLALDIPYVVKIRHLAATPPTPSRRRF